MELAPRKGWRAKAPSKEDALRALLSDGRWHGPRALQQAGGDRYGARLFDAHSRADLNGRMPLHYEKRVNGGDDSHVSYRQVDAAHCSVCAQERRERPTTVIQRQAQRIAELERELARARAAAGFGGAM